MPIIDSKYAGKCKKCAGRYSVGARIFWSKATGALCLACHEGGGSSSRGTSTNGAGSPSSASPRAARGRITRRFGSWGEFVECADKSKRESCQSCEVDESAKPFQGTRDWDTAFKLARHGWSEIRPEVDALVSEIDHKVAPSLQAAFSSYFDVSGGTVDIGRFLDGEPECMVETRLVEIAKPGRVIGILINGVVNASVNTKQIERRGAAIVALIDTLEKLQHSTEIHLEISINENYTVLVKLKGAEDMLDIDTLMFAIAHPATLRRLFFAMVEGEKESRVSKLATGFPRYGTAMKELLCGKDIDATLELVGMTPEGDAAKWITETLTKFGLVKEEG